MEDNERHQLRAPSSHVGMKAAHGLLSATCVAAGNMIGKFKSYNLFPYTCFSVGTSHPFLKFRLHSNLYTLSLYNVVYGLSRSE